MSGKKPSLAVNSAFNVLYQCVAVIAPLVISMHVSRVLMPEGVGLVASANNVVSYFITLAPLGIPAYGLREIAKVRDSKDSQDILFSELFILNAASSLVFLALYILCYPLLFSGQYEPALYFVFASLVFMNCFNVDWFYQGKEEYAYIALRSIAVKLASLAFVLIFVRSSSDVVSYAVILCFATAGNYFFNIARLRKYVRFRLKGIRPLRHMRAVFVLAGTVVLFSIYTKISVTILGTFCDSENIGYYSNAYSAANIVLALCNAVTGVFFPRFSYEFEHDRSRFDSLVTQAFSVNLLVSLPLAIGMFLVAPDAVVVLFGESFAPAATVMRVFALLIIFKCLGNVIYQVCISTRKEKGQLLSYAAGAVACLLGNIVLIPMFDEVGAASATVLAEFIVDVTLVFYLGDCFRLKLERRFLLSLVGSLAAMVAVVFVCYWLIESPLIRMLSSFFLGGGAFIAVSLVTGNSLFYSVLNRVRSRIHT